MKLFKINKRISVLCQTLPTRVAFKHTATLMFYDYGDFETKICYLNRTWEVFQYESVLKKLLDKVVIEYPNWLDKKDIKDYKKMLRERAK